MIEQVLGPFGEETRWRVYCAGCDINYVFDTIREQCPYCDGGLPDA